MLDSVPRPPASRPRRPLPLPALGPHGRSGRAAAGARRRLRRRAPAPAGVGAEVRAPRWPRHRPPHPGEHAADDHRADGPAVHRDRRRHHRVPDPRRPRHRSCCARSRTAPSRTPRSPTSRRAIARSQAPATASPSAGEAACARGRDDERSWSRPDAPDRVAGRYRCQVAATRAEMWWTVDDAGVLAHATRTDGDLAALFSWWRARSEG